MSTNVLSAKRRSEILDALRRGTVPQDGLDVLAVGLGRFESAMDQEIANEDMMLRQLSLCVNAL